MGDTTHASQSQADDKQHQLADGKRTVEARAAINLWVKLYQEERVGGTHSFCFAHEHMALKVGRSFPRRGESFTRKIPTDSTDSSKRSKSLRRCLRARDCSDGQAEALRNVVAPGGDT